MSKDGNGGEGGSLFVGIHEADGLRVEKIGGSVYEVRRLEGNAWRRIGAVCADSLREATVAARYMLASDDV